MFPNLQSMTILSNLPATDCEGRTECYWGFDHIGQVAAHLGLDRPEKSTTKEDGWRAML